MRQVLDTNPNRLVFILAILGGFSNVLGEGPGEDIGLGNWVFFFGALISGAIVGFLALITLSALV